MRNKKWIFLSLWVFLPGLFHSCQEETVTAEDPELLTRQEVQFEELMADLDAMVDEALFLQLNPLKAATGEGDYFRNSCPVVTYSRSDGTRVLTLNFGEGAPAATARCVPGKSSSHQAPLKSRGLKGRNVLTNSWWTAKKWRAVS